jgi:hypothetical protein
MGKPNVTQREQTARLRADGLTQSEIAKIQDRSRAAVTKQIAQMGGDPQSSESVLAKTKQVKLALTYELHRKQKAANDRMAGKLVERERVNALLLAHARRLNLALSQLRAIDETHATSAAALLLDCYEDFGAEADALLTEGGK